MKPLRQPCRLLQESKRRTLNDTDKSLFQTKPKGKGAHSRLAFSFWNRAVLFSAVLNPNSGQTTVTGSINGWTIGPKGEDARVNNELLNVFSVACTAASGCSAASDLNIQVTDSNFSPATGEFSLAFSDTQAGIGTATESAYFDANNRPFAETTLIGTLGPFAADSTFSLQKLVDKASPKSSL